MSTLAANECRRQVRYDYTAPERIAKATGLAEALNRYTATENEKKRIAKDYESRLDIIQAEVDQLSGCVLSGYELREYLCFYTYDDPRSGRKTLRKRESNEIVGEEDMTERDRQMVMEIIDAQAAKGDAADLAKPVLALAPARNMPTEVTQACLDDSETSSFDFTDEQCQKFGLLVHEVFIAIPDDGVGEDQLRDDQGRDTAICTVLNRESNECLVDFAKWLREEPRPGITGLSWLADAVEAHLKGVEIQRTSARAREAAQKKESRKSRRAAGPGTVDLPSDEGSRDDAGADSKNNL